MARNSSPMRNVISPEPWSGIDSDPSEGCFRQRRPTTQPAVVESFAEAANSRPQTATPSDQGCEKSSRRRIATDVNDSESQGPQIAAIDGVRQRAFDLIPTNGFNVATVETVAALPSVSPTTVTSYFATKEALVPSTQQPLSLVERISRNSLSRPDLVAFTPPVNRICGGGGFKAAPPVYSTNSARLVVNPARRNGRYRYISVMARRSH